MNKAVVSLGSNLNPNKYISEAKQALYHHFHIIKESSFVLTKPIDLETDRLFLNGSILLETTLDLAGLKKQLKNIETDIQKTASQDKIKERVIDLDITIWNSIVVDEDYYKRSYLKQAVSELTYKS